MSLRSWAEGVRAEYHEGALLPAPGRERRRIYGAMAILRPRQFAQHLLQSYRKWTVQPGDQWTSFQMDLVGVVREVRRDHVWLEVASGQIIAACPSWPDRYPVGAVPMFRNVSRNDPYWWPT